MATIIKNEVKQFVKDCIENSQQKIGHKVTHSELLSVIRLQLPSLELSSPNSKKTAFFKEVEKHLIAKCVVELMTK